MRLSAKSRNVAKEIKWFTNKEWATFDISMRLDLRSIYQIMLCD